MLLHIITASNRQPEWVETAFSSYAKRFSGPLQMKCTQVRLARNLPVERAREEEGRRLLQAAGRGALIVALEGTGRSWTTRQLAEKLDEWIGNGVNPCFLIGGPDGHTAATLAAADVCWSLSPLTLPHSLARIIAAEALYRAASLLAGHPYHRD